MATGLSSSALAPCANDFDNSVHYVTVILAEYCTLHRNFQAWRCSARALLTDLLSGVLPAMRRSWRLEGAVAWDASVEDCLALSLQFSGRASMDGVCVVL